MENFARIVLNNAQTLYDGGDIGKILKNVPLLNNSKLKQEALFYLTSLRLSGGYVAALFFGVLWISIMIFLMIFLCFTHFKRSQKDSKRNRAFLVSFLSTPKGKKPLQSSGSIIQLSALGAVLIPVLLLLSLSLANIVYLSRSISEPANQYEPNKTEKVDSLLPAFRKSLLKTRLFLSTFAERARIDTKSTVEEIIVATKKMQEETSANFNNILMGRLGVSENFRHGDEMTRIVVMFFEASAAVLEARVEYEALLRLLYPSAMTPEGGVFRLLSLLNLSVSEQQLALCDHDCKEAAAFFSRKFVPEDRSLADTEFASSFLFVMRQRNETKESVAAKSAHGRRSMAATMAKTKKRMEELVDVGGTVRNVTAGTWTQMEKQMRGPVSAIDKLLFTLSKTSTNRYSAVLAIVLLIPLVLTTVVAVSTVCFLCNGGRGDRFRVAVYTNLSLLAIAVFFATVTFLVGGKAETELCRYLRTEQPLAASANSSRVILDSHINSVLGKTLRKLPKRGDFPLPSPRDVLYGVLHRCRHNEPILAALDAIDSMDARALSKPEASEKIVAIGRMLMLESLNETDPRKMMPGDMEESLKQASQMDMFKKMDIAATIGRIPRSPIREKRGNLSVEVPRNLFIDRIEKFLTIYGPLFKDQNKRKSLEEDFQKLLLLLERFNIVTDRARQLFRGLENIPKIEPVVRNLQKSLKSMLALMSNKTELLAIGNEYYDRIIVKNTPRNAADIMEKFGPKMMGKLGRCRPLFEAYQSIVDTTCDVVVSKFNAYWLYLGTVVLLLTVFLSVVLVAFVRLSPEPAVAVDLNMNSDTKNCVSKPLCELPNDETEDDTVKTML